MPDIVKILGTEVSLSSASSTISTATVVRIFNNGATSLLTVKDGAGTTIGSTTIAGGGVIFITKPSSGTITSATAVLATPVAFTN